MMSDNQYKDYVNTLIDKSLETYLPHQNSMELSDKVESLVNQKDNSTLEALFYWEQRLSQNEIDKIKGYGDAFLFDIEEDYKIYASALICDLDFRLRLRYLKSSLEKYSISQPLFDSNDKLLSQTLNCELLPSTLFHKVPFANVVQLNYGKYVYIDESLETPLLAQLEKRGSSYYVRVNPHYVYDKCPPSLIKRETWRPPSPKWGNAIGIKHNCKDGFSYYIPDDIDLHTHPIEYNDRHILGVFRIEGKYEREKDGRFSMMVEELKEEKHPFLDEFYIIGRMIHLDSYEDGEHGLNSKLEHIDLAVYLYDGNNAYRRRNVRLENWGEKIKTPSRSHVLRVNNTQLSDIILFSTFFESKCITDEWINEMFTIKET